MTDAVKTHHDNAFAAFSSERAKAAKRQRKARYRPVGMDETIDLAALGPEPRFVTVPKGVDGVRLNEETLAIEILRGGEVVETLVHTGDALIERLRQLESGMDRKRFRAFRRGLDHVLRGYEFVLDRDAWVKRVKPEIAALPDWEAAGLTLERPDGSALADIRARLAQGRVAASRALLDDLERLFSGDGATAGEAGGPPQSFVIEHDWAAAFQHAEDVAEGEIRAPYDATLFEFAVSGRRVCHLYVKGCYPVQFISITGGWAADAYRDEADRADDIASHFVFNKSLSFMLSNAVRAVCVALDAGVAERETVRAPDALNRARVKRGKPALPDYHVVRLARRERAAPLEAGGDGDAEGARRRLHFVRGHWRRYGGHKTWIRWHLRGDPDLGFIDKHYAL